MDVEAKKELYDMLYAIGQQVIDHYNPCGWKNGRCRRMRSSKRADEGCCAECNHLNKGGCTVKSLSCKLWLCENQSNTIFKQCAAELKVLRLVAEYCVIPCGHRKSKEENFGF